MPTPRRLLLPAVLAWVQMTGCNAAPPPLPPPPPTYTPVADVKQLMAMLVEPAADVYWNAVGTVEDKRGLRETAPQTAEQWDAVRNSALVVAESGNLLLMPSRLKDSTQWVTLSRGMIDAARTAMQVAEAHDKVAVFNAGAALYDSCVACHVKYYPEILKANAEKE